MSKITESPKVLSGNESKNSPKKYVSSLTKNLDSGKNTALSNKRYVGWNSLTMDSR